MLEKYDWGFQNLCATKDGTNGLRTPLTLSDKIKDDISDKVFCDLGCGEGDFALCCKRYAKRVIGVEKDPERAEVARMKGLEVITGDILLVSLPEADVYYLWIGQQAPQVYEKLKKGKTLIVGLGNNNPIGLENWLKQFKVTANTMNYIREGIPMTFGYYKIITA